MNDDLWPRLTQVFQDVFDETPPLSTETTAEQVEGWDSVRHVELMIAIEREFSIRFDTSELANLANVGELVELIRHKGG